MMDLDDVKEFKEELEDINMDAYPEYVYRELYSLASDYNEIYDNVPSFEEYIDRDILEEMAKRELENGGLERLYNFMPQEYSRNENYFRIDGYGNCQNITAGDVDILKSEIVDALAEVENELQEEEEVDL